jgi:2-polyprenyl-3-methyl-5-hydroxy-6-metoxy-1,4-benzoquinol methylase
VVVLLTITVTGPDAQGLGFLLHKHPDRVQRFSLAVGNATVCYPESDGGRCTAALLLEVDPVGLVRRRGRGGDGLSLVDYVTDRPYAASSMLAVALGRVFNTALNGRCDARPDLAAAPLPLEVRLPAVPVRPTAGVGGVELLERLFRPLGWQVAATGTELRPGGGWGPAPYLDLTLTGTLRLADALSHLYVLLPVLDAAKHYWVSTDEVDKLIRRGEGWLAGHPDRDLILRRYLAGRRTLVEDATARLLALEELSDPEGEAEDGDPGTDRPDPDPLDRSQEIGGPVEGPVRAGRAGIGEASTSSAVVGPGDRALTIPEPVEGPVRAGRAGLGEASTSSAVVGPCDRALTIPEPVEGSVCAGRAGVGEASTSSAAVGPGSAVVGPDPGPTPLRVLRLQAVLDVVREIGAHRVVDLGCGEGHYLRALLAEPSITDLLGVDVSARALERAGQRLGLERLSDHQRARVRLRQSSVTYRDDELAGYDAMLLVEVVEHLEPDRLGSLEANVFGAARPAHIVLTTPNAEFNARYDLAGSLRHPDHRFEWTRAEFAEWCETVAARHGYRVGFRDVGEPDPELGPPTQLALFTRDAA